MTRMNGKKKRYIEKKNSAKNKDIIEIIPEKT
jgi:hypothetical protein